MATRRNDTATIGIANYLYDEGFTSEVNENWKGSTGSTWLKEHPEGFLALLRYVHENYNQPEIIITENGWSEDGSTLNDTDRIEYLGVSNSHFQALKGSI